MSCRKLNLLMITVYPLYPNCDGYTLRMWNFLKGLKDLGHKVTLMSFCTNAEQARINTVQIHQICSKFIPISFNRKFAYFRIMKALFKGTPLKAEYFNSTYAKRIIKQEVNNNEYDYICGYHYLTMPFLDLFPDKKRWIELCDSISMLHERNIKTAKNIFEKLFLISERKRVLKMEKRCIDNCNVVTLISQIDKDFLSKYYDVNKIAILPNGVKIPNLTSTKYNQNEICFLGCMNYIQNHQAVMWFIKNVFLELTKMYPELKFKIIGRDPRTELLKFVAGNKKIIVTGKVENVIDEMISANFMVCPISISAGVQNKVLESMALGVPVISSSNVAKPISEDKNIILQANTKDEWISTINKMIPDSVRREELSKKSREYIKNHFSWEKAIDILNSELING